MTKITDNFQSSMDRETSQTYTKKEIEEWVPETRFGKWFLSTDVWYRYVLSISVQTLRELLGKRHIKNATLLEIGCGEGQSLTLLDQVFKPKSITGVDIDENLLRKADKLATQCHCSVVLEHGNANNLTYSDNNFDWVFCHQLIHHVRSQEAVLSECFRVLKPGGFLLLNESCKPFLKVYWVKWFFRHPKMEQKTAHGYIDLVKNAGYIFNSDDVVESTPWWSRRDLGLLQKIGLQFWRLKTPEVFIVAQKPL